MDCKKLSSITISDSVTSIGGFAFWDCSNLKIITIPDSVTSIGYGVFEGCSNVAIYGKSGSYAETYASEGKFPFVAIPMILEGFTDTDDEYGFAVSVSDCESTANVSVSLYNADGKPLGIRITPLVAGDVTSVSFGKADFPTAVKAKIFAFDKLLRPVAEQKEVKLA